MLNEFDTVKLIFGLKIAQLRREQNLSFQQLSDHTGLAISYLHNIEKGKKYPKGDKIIVLAKALKTDYNYLVSLDAGKKLQPIFDLLNSDFLKMFPLEQFGIDLSKLLELLSQTPDKMNAFINTVLKMTRNYQLQGEDFYKAALRSYQELYDNYFEELEQAVRAMRQQYQIKEVRILNTEQLENILKDKFGIRVNRSKLGSLVALNKVRSYYQPGQKTLYLNDGLSNAQENNLIAKEIGFQFLGFRLEERPLETRMLEISSFEELLNNFKASYFAVALLLDEQSIIKDLKRIAAETKWRPELIASLLAKYNVSSEVLIQRLANILPHHFGIHDLFFLRFYTQNNMAKFEMTKEMHLSQLHNPYANQLEEHYCRRWISTKTIQQLSPQQTASKIQIGAQISHYTEPEGSYLCISLAKKSTDQPGGGTSVTIGLLVNDQLKRLFKWLKDPSLDQQDVHTTCERCAIEHCSERMAKPIVLEASRGLKKTKAALEAI